MGAIGAEVQTGIIDLYEAAPYRDMRGENRLFPLIIIHAGNFHFEGVELGYTLHQGERASLRLLAAPTMFGYESGDSPYLEGMGKRKEDFAAGAEFSYRLGMKQISLQVTQDLSDAHKSYGAKLEFVLKHRLSSQLQLEPYVGVRYLSADKADYYYGVADDEARVGRPAYHLEGASNGYLGVNTVYLLDNAWRLFGNIEQRVLDSDITASPIVGRNRAVSAYLGVTYLWPG
jgi:outer membrane protein